MNKRICLHISLTSKEHADFIDACDIGGDTPANNIRRFMTAVCTHPEQYLIFATKKICPETDNIRKLHVQVPRELSENYKQICKANGDTVTKGLRMYINYVGKSLEKLLATRKKDEGQT